MNLEISKTYHGFKLTHQETIRELKSLALQFEHEITGAGLVVMENDDDNKVFSIAFRTPPGNNTGIAHILEHSVLCGSRKYPVKEPFVELLKGSLRTFLNAMTFPDKTLYPVASRNIKDLYNLMNVYLDAVFFPRITREIFMQEGWHYDLEEPEREIEYKGVVFNEMKGVFSDAESIIDRYLNHSLFPDSIYGLESGGDPQQIPDLTYEEFLDFHRKYYHPSNSRIFIYGDGNTQDYLRFLHEDYLQSFSRKDANSAIRPQKKFTKTQRSEISYPVSKDESLKKKTFVAMGFLLDKSTDQEHCLGCNILSHMLLGTPASPLRKALIDSGIGSEVIGGGFDDQRSETLFTVGLKGTEKADENKIIDLILSTLKNLADNGIEKDMIEAAVNSVDFKLREANFGGFPKGIVYNIQALGSWLYDADPLMHLKYDDLMAKIKENSQKGYFENLIRRYLLDNPHRSILVATPDPAFAEKEDERERKRLEQFKTSLSAGEIEKLVEETLALQALQAAPDSAEALATLPKLGKEDLNRKTDRFPFELKKAASPKILFHDLFTNKIGYVQVGFDTRSVPLDNIQYIPLLGKLIFEMGTRKHSYVEISQMLGIHTGGIRATHFTTAPLTNRQEVLSHIFFNGKAVFDKLDKLFDIYAELLGEFDFDNPKRLVDIIRGTLADIESAIIPAGNQYVLSRLQSYGSRVGMYDEITGGIAYFRFMEHLLAQAEKNPEEVADRFKQTARAIFSRRNMLVNITSEAADYPKFESKIKSLVEVFPDQGGESVALDLPPAQTNEAFLTSSSIQYVGKGANLYSLGFKYSGHFDVLKSILNTGFLWDKVRVQGGAYGCSSSFDFYSGDFGIVSYRDPNLEETLSVYDEIADFVSNLDITEDELTKFVIGCVGHLDPPLSPDRKGSVSMVEHLTGMTWEMKQKRRDEVISTTLEDIKAFGSLFKKIRESGHVCALGNEDKIRGRSAAKESGNHFNHLVKVFN